MTYSEAIKSSNVVLVEFYATWCPHCRRMMPVIDEIRELLEGQVNVIQLDIDENQELSDTENVTATPTFILYRGGREQWRHTGEIPAESLLAKIQSYL